MSNELYRILNNPQSSIRETNQPLAKLFRIILSDNNITAMQFNELLSAYLDNPAASGVRPGDRNARSSTRGNRIKEITKKSITWDNFMKALMILDPDHVDFSVTLHWPSKKVTYHSIGMSMREDFAPVETETVVNGQTITTNIPPVAQSHWSGTRTGGGMVPNAHENVTYQFGEQSDKKKGDDE